MTDKRVFQIILTLSVVVFAVVAVLYQFPKAAQIPAWAQQLPRLNALINGTCSILLLCSLAAIRKKNIPLHKKLNITTFGLSALFLVSYIVFHSFGVETSFPKDNPIRPVYLLILISHIVLAAAVFPLVLTSFYLGLGGNVELHKRVSRFTYPVWLYVTVTGVVVFLMISPYYSF
jgi:putative membrane protein